MIRTYSKLLKFDSFEDRYRYLKLGDKIGEETFGFDRWINQEFYNSKEWKSLRNEIIIRDNGCDLGIQNREISGRIYIHHLNPIRKADILEHSEMAFDPEFLISCSKRTHDAIHYGDESILILDPVERKPGDTVLWR